MLQYLFNVDIFQTLWISHCAEFAQGMVLPTGSSAILRASSSGQSTAGTTPSASQGGKVGCSPDSRSMPSGLRIPTRRLNGEEEFQCTAEDLYLTLTQSERVEAFTQCVAQVDACKGGQFVLFAGNITGTFVELVSGLVVWREGWVGGGIRDG